MKYLLPFLFLFSCESFSRFLVTEEHDDIIINYRNGEVIASRFKAVPGDDKKFLTVTDKKSGKTWDISYADWKVLNLAYTNWRIVESDKPFISKIEEDDTKIIVTFNYITDTKIDNVKASVLSGKIYLNKKFIKGKDRINPVYVGAATGISVYAIIVTLVLIL